MDFSKIDPNLVIGIVVALGGWLWKQFQGKHDEKKKDESVKTQSLFDSIVESMVYELIDKYPINVDVETYLKNSRGYLESKFWAIATKRGIPRNKVTEVLMHIAIERGGALLAQEIKKLRDQTREAIQRRNE